MKSRKIKRCISSFIGLIISLFFVFSNSTAYSLSAAYGMLYKTNRQTTTEATSLSNNIETVKLASSSTNPTITASSANSSDGYFTPNTSGNIYITLSLSAATDHDVKIYFHAADATAVSEAGDYYYTNGDATSSSSNTDKADATHKQSVVTITAGKTTTGINYYTKKTSIVTNYNGIQRSYFTLCIDRVDGATAPTTRYNCGLNYTRCLNGREYNGAVMYSDYWVYGYEKFDDSVDSSYASDCNLHKYGQLIQDNSSENVKASEAYNNLVSSGLANIYTSLHVDVESGGWIFAYVCDCCFDTSLFVNGTLDLYYYNPGGFRSASGYCSTQNNRGGYKDNYAKINANEGYDYHIHTWNQAANVSRDVDFILESHIWDASKPQINGFYIDPSYIKSDGKVKVLVRFSEPVQVTNNNLALQSYFSASADKTTTIKFSYAGGSLTNTLIFETSVTTLELEANDKLITKFFFSELENIQYLRDLGCNKNNSNNGFTSLESKSYIQNLSKPYASCNIDLRIPELSIPKKNTTNIAKDRQIDLTINRMAAGTVYYSWRKESDLVLDKTTDYQSYTTFLKDGQVTHEMSITGSNMSGEYYLYVMAVSESGKVKTAKYGRAKADGTIIGGFLFDNTKPTINEGTIIKNDLAEKVFEITVGDGTSIYDSGVSSIYLHVAKNKDITHANNPICIYSSSNNQLGLTRYGYELSSSSLYLTTYIDDVSEVEYVKGTSLDGYVFSSKDAAIDFVSLLEYYDLKIEKKFYDDSFTLADGESKPDDCDYAYYIRYKSSDFNYNSYHVGTGNVIANNVGHDEYVYYLYSKDATVDTTKLNMSLVKDSLKAAIDANATKVVNKGSTVDLLANNYLENDYTTIITTKKSFLKNTLISSFTYLENSIIQEEFIYKDIGFKMTSAGGSYLYSLSAEDLGLGVNKYGYYTIWFTAYDAVGNETVVTTNKNYVKYDRRILFDSYMTATLDGIPTSSIDSMVEAYDIDKGNVELTFTTDLTSEDDGTIKIKSVYYQNDEIELASSTYSKYFTASTPVKVGTTNNSSITITFNEPGYYKFEFELLPNTTNYDPTKLKLSEAYEFYITKSMEENTLNYTYSQGNNVLNNKVFQLGTSYYYLDLSGKIQTISYNYVYKEKDPEIRLADAPATFSSKSVAASYVKYMEYQDFYLLVLNAQTAETLNNGVNKNFIKADGEESKTASAGQAWIRYKRRTWSKDSTEYDWVYYYYGEAGTTSISIGSISDNLQLAIDDVTTYIISNGYVTNLVGESYTDKNGAPTLDMTQRHADVETKTYTFTNSSCTPVLEYKGDKDLYKNSISYSDNGTTNEISLSSNSLLYNENLNRVFYAYYDGSILESLLTFTELTFEDGDTYRKAIDGGTGIYIIREFGKEGMNQYRVYIDNSAPCVQVLYRSATDNLVRNPIFDSSSNNQTYSAKSFTIGSIDSTGEKDELSYVAVYNKNNMRLLNVYFYEYLQTNFVELETGEYYILVSDRSGNSYHFNAYVNDTELEVVAEIIDNDYVQVTINRTAEQIYLYEVYLNNSSQPFDKTWEGTKKKYRESGSYRIVVRDIYGFVVEIGGDSNYAFERDLPKITWSYLGDDGSYHKYDDTTTCMKITQSLGSTIYINTSKQLRFTMDGEYEYTFTGLEKNEISTGFLSKVVSINSTNDWELDIWYADFPDITAHYVCRMDTMAPEINLSYKASSWMLEETENMLARMETSKVGDIYPPTSIGYSLEREKTTGISDGDIIDSNLIRLELYDASGVQDLEIYLDDVLFKEFHDGVDIDTLTLSRFGKYKIIAIDVFGNKRTLSFTNEAADNVEYTLDGASQELRDKVTLYGHDNTTLTVLENGLVAIKVTANNKSYVNLYNVNNSKVTIAEYRYVSTEVTKGYSLVDKTYKGINSYGETVDLSYVVIDAYDSSFKINKWYQILSYSTDGYNLYVSYDKNRNILFKVDVLDTKTLVEFRASFDNMEPYYFNTYLSTEVTDATLITEDLKTIETNKEGITYTNQSFTFDENIDKDIVSINISYSDTRDFKEYVDVYPTTILVDNKEEIGVTQFDTSRNGFYSINVLNIYGNVATYTVNRSDVFVVITEATYDDQTYNRYNEKYELDTKSNGTILLEAYSANASFIVTRNGLEYQPSVEKEDGYYTVTFVKEGTYNVRCIDNNYGNIIDKTLIIDHSSTLQYSDDLLEGYNKLALINNDKVYSNKTLSIVNEKIGLYGIKYLSISYEENENILYNTISQDIISIVEGSLTNAIGSNGDGLYTITIRDEYGNVARRVVDYRSTTTIEVSRRTRTSNEDDAYTIEDVIENGIYSNSIINIKGDATYYTLKVDGEVCPLPYQLALLFQSGAATIPHVVEYLDEYGNSYTFDAVLERKELTLTVDSSINEVEIESIPTTRDNVKLAFSEGNCTYTLDGSDPISYTSDTTLKKDGYYRFTLQDRAGNVTTRAIKKDTYVDYYFRTSSSSYLVSGQVVNNGPVEFGFNSKDNVTIKYMYLDDVLQTKPTNKYSDQGHYMFLLEDKIGNQSFFEFYLIKYEISEFNYQTPTSYKITDAWYSIGDGNFVSYMNSGAISQFDSYSTISLNENGIYQITMTSELYSNGVSFGIEINNTAPVVSLVGCNEGEKTIEDVKVTGYKPGDTIRIYRDSKLVSTTQVISTLTDSPVMDEGGKYEVVVTNRAGVSTTLKFERKRIANNSGSALIIIACLAMAIGLLIGVVLRNKQKFDE